LRSALFEQAKVDVRCTQRVKRVFVIDRETCTGCGGKLRVIARMLTHP
jgi:rRNA maturation endonuclease Nob1